MINGFPDNSKIIQIEPNLLKNYKFVLQTNKIPSNTHGYYMKWLRFYLDFCHKYDLRKTDPGRNLLQSRIRQESIQLKM